MKRIDYDPNSLSHHNENIQYWVTQGIVIDGERYSVEELFVRGNTLYGVLSTNKIDFYEYPLATNVTQNKFDPSGILNRLDRLESIPQYKYDDTGVNKRLDSIENEFDTNKDKTDQRLTLLENKPDKDNQELSISGYDLSISGGNTVKIPQPDLKVLNDFATKEYVDSLVKSSKYDPEPILDRLQILESKPDKDTVYDDTDLKRRVKALEDKPEKSDQTLSISNRTISISNGNSIELPVDKDTIYDDTDLKKRVSALEFKPDKDTIYDDTALKQRVKALEDRPDNDTITKVVSTSNGVNVSSSVNSNIVTYDVNIDRALDNYYDKAKTYTKDEVNEIVKKQEQKATDITVYRGTFTNRDIVKEGTFDTDRSPRVTLTYSSSTGVGILKVDFMILSRVGQAFPIAKLPNNAPVPAELIESQVWIGNVNTSVWVDKGDKYIKMYLTTDPSIFNKRIILNIPGIFKLN